MILKRIVPKTDFKQRRRLEQRKPKFQMFKATPNIKPSDKAYTCTHLNLYNALIKIVDECKAITGETDCDKNPLC